MAVRRFALPLALALAALTGPARAAEPGFAQLEPGLDLGVFAGPGAVSGDDAITVVRVDPVRFELRLFNASAPGEGVPRTVRAWAERSGAVAAINAAMYQEDHRSSVGLMRTRSHVNHARVSRDRAVLAFDPIASGIPPVRIIDRECENFDAAAGGYGALVQSIRMVSCDRRNVWAPSDRRSSAAVIGLDGTGRVLLLHVRAPSDVHALVDTLLALPVDLRRAMYVEGGAEAQLVVRAGGREVERVGATAGLFEAGGGKAVPVPNVIVVVRRAR
jgi:hypothetical protein